MPKESCPLDDALVDRELRALLVLLDELSPEREDASHKVLLLIIARENAVVFLAEVPEVVEPYKLLGARCDELDVHVLGEEEVVVLAKDAGEAGIERGRDDAMP